MARPVDVWEIEDAVKGVGAFPQIQDSIGGNWESDDPRSAYALVNWHHLPLKPPPFGKLLLAPRARLTDVLSSAQIRGPGFIVNERLRRLLATFDLGEHGVYPARVLGEKLHHYFWVQVVNDVLARVDFKCSEFRTRPGIATAGGGKAIRFASAAGLKRHVAPTKAGGFMVVEAKQVMLRGAQRAYPDLFRFDFGIRVYASARLKAAFEREKVTGVQFRPAPIRFSA
jgi:hypothetical protein